MLISQKGHLLNDEFILQIDGINSLRHTESFNGGRVLVTIVPLGSLNYGFNLRWFRTGAQVRFFREITGTTSYVICETQSTSQ